MKNNKSREIQKKFVIKDNDKFKEPHRMPILGSTKVLLHGLVKSQPTPKSIAPSCLVRYSVKAC